jgi:acyl-CoA synthetase (AMP-forming)/AMP-acid ligase II
MNVADQITDKAIELPYKRAVVMGRKSLFSLHYYYEHYTFIDLEKRINQFSHRFITSGVKRGDKVLVFVKPSVDFCAYTFSLFKIGAIPVLIDPGMGLKNVLSSIESIDARVLLGIPAAHAVARIFKKKFKSIEIFLCTSEFSVFSKSMTRKIDSEISLFDAVDMNSEDTAAILFTSGGTGVPKGVVYTHNIFIEQTSLLKTAFGLTSDDIDIPGFPLFALFTLSMGMTSIIPDMNPSKPGKSDPKKLLKNIMDHGATFVAGSPAIWKKLADHCLEHRITLPSIKYLVMFGAPIPVELHHKFKKILPSGTTYTPYGATECLPVCNISGRAILNNHADNILSGNGTCIGQPLSEVNVEIIEFVEGIVDSTNFKVLETGEIGEIVVQSKVATRSYYNLPVKTEHGKIELNDAFYHRMGDMGYFDEQGNIWFCGRASHFFKIGSKKFFPILFETVINQHSLIEKSALIKNTNKAKFVIQRIDKKTTMSDQEKSAFDQELKEIVNDSQFKNFKFDYYLHKELPVDVRHNIKIDRIALTLWAQELEEE